MGKRVGDKMIGGGGQIASKDYFQQLKNKIAQCHHIVSKIIWLCNLLCRDLTELFKIKRIKGVYKTLYNKKI